MPRRARVILPGTPLHLIQRGNNRAACFFDDQDYQFYLEWLAEYARGTGCSVHAYVLMTNHVHLLVSGKTSRSVGTMMKRLGQRYVQYVNRTYRRSGTLWEGRFRSCLTREEAYVLACYRYIELNPVRAGMVQKAADYPWSSFKANAYGKEDQLTRPHPVYLALGANDGERRQAYRGLFRQALEPADMQSLRTGINLCVPVGADRFKAQIERQLQQRISYKPRGRPKKEKVVLDSQE